jgi:hypothetical protein
MGAPIRGQGMIRPAIPPRPEEIKAIRESLGMTCQEFDAALGYSTDGRITQAMEAGRRGERAFEMTGSAHMALRWLQAVERAVRLYGSGDISAEEAVEELRLHLPERLR